MRSPLRSVSLARLEPEVRVYFHNPESFRWQIGRILDYQESDKKYLVRFPNDERRLIPESQLAARWLRPIDDPTDHLALQLNETPYWHGGRSAFIHSIYSQRHACGGMPGLLSTAIDLVEHQVSVVRRVLQDPFQRYLLADEVGLGKTIEAGVLIRQFVLDEYDSQRVIVIVPDSLIQQWKSELRLRFHLEDQVGKSIHIIGNRDHEAIERFGSDANMIVIDEAHHVAAWAHSADARLARLFQCIAKITHPPQRRVLLLSATPVLLSEGELVGLFLAERLVQQYRGTYFEIQLEHAFAKMLAAPLPAGMRVGFSAGRFARTQAVAACFVEVVTSDQPNWLRAIMGCVAPLSSLRSGPRVGCGCLRSRRCRERSSWRSATGRTGRCA